MTEVMTMKIIMQTVPRSTRMPVCLLHGRPAEKKHTLDSFMLLISSPPLDFNTLKEFRVILQPLYISTKPKEPYLAHECDQ